VAAVGAAAAVVGAAVGGTAVGTAVGTGVAAGAQAAKIKAADISTARPLKAFPADEREFWVIISSFGSMGETVTFPVPSN